jgi:hypothetical protein
MAGNMWIASFPKSGNTWTRAFLANYLFGGKDPISINEMDQHCAHDADVRYYEQFLEGDIQSLPPKDVYAVRPQVHRFIAEKSDESVLVKIHNRNADFLGVPTITKDVTAGAIYVVRNPLDTVVSYANHIGQSIDFASEAMASSDLASPASKNLIMSDLGSWSDHVRTWVNTKGVYMILVHYEAMIQNPEKTFESLISFLQVPLDKKKLHRALEFSSFEALAAQEKAHGFLEQPPNSNGNFFRSGKMGGWRDILNKDQLEYNIRAHSHMMRQVGYLDGNGNPTV